MAKCPNCGGELSPQENGLWTCAVCGKVYSRKVVTVQDTLPADQTEAELRARIAAMEAKQAETERQLAAAQAKSGGGGKAAEFFRSKKHLLKYIIPGVLLLVACIILLVCFCGLRGIYVNVDNPNDYFSFGVGTFSTVDSGDVVDGKWSRDGDTLTLTLEDELLGEIELPVSFKKVSGYDVVEIDGAEYKRVSVIRMEDNLSKVNISFNANGGSFTEGRSSYDLSLGGKIDSAPSVERSSGNYIFMGWYTSPDSWTTGEGERFSPGIRLWEDASYYANWRNDTDYTMSVPDILNRGEDAPEITYREGDDLLSVFMTALGWSELPDGITGVSFSTSSGAVDASSAPAANVTAELVGDYMVLDGVLRYVSPSLTEFIIPDSAISISNRAFDDCSGLASVTIGANITSLNTSVFDDCDELTTLNVAEGNTVYRSAGNCIIDAENQTLILGCKGSVIPADGSVTTIGENAFNGLTGLISITIPESITKIEDSAFENCTGLTEINWNAIAVEDFAEFSSYMYEYEDVYTKVFSGAGTDGSGITVTFGDAVTHVPAGLFCSPNSGFNSYDYITPNIKSVFIGDNVAAVGAYAFARCKGITEIILPENLTNIGDCVFSGCTGLTSITIPDSVASIGSYAFGGCTGLTSIAIPDSVTSIEDSVFNGCTGLTSITIPDSVASIGSYAFGGCTGLTSITIPDSVTSIGHHAFSDCAGLTAVTIPNAVANVGSNAFAGCVGLTEINWNAVAIEDSDANVSIFASAGAESTGITVTFGSDVESIPAYLFYASNYDTPKVINVVIGDNVTSIGDSAFRGCAELTWINIPDSVTHIGESAFKDCIALTSIAIPNSVTSIGAAVFSGCSALESITMPYVGFVQGTSSYPFGRCFGTSSYDGGVEVEQHYSYGVQNGNVTTYYTRRISYYIPATLRSVALTDGDLTEYAFENFSMLTSVTLPEGITSITSEAFYNCSGLQSIVIPDTVTIIDGRSFYNCTGLTSVSIPDMVTEIGYAAFSGCSGLTSVDIPDGVTTIEGQAFKDCTRLTSITVPDSVTSMGDAAFENCAEIIEIEDGVYYVGNWAIGCDENIASVSIREGTKGIAGYAFSDKANLNAVTLSASVTGIGERAFSGCTGLTAITIPGNVNNIGYRAFSECTNLSSVIFEETTGWYRRYWGSRSKISSSSLADPTEAATLLTSTYTEYEWERNA